MINSAANAYVWSNVAEYDFAFRQMLACNPRRNWAKIYTQMWNICMTETIQKNSFQFQSGGTTGTTTSRGQYPSNSYKTTPGGNSGSGAAMSAKNKPDYCWKFNKGKCKFGNECRFINRCSYCDAANHGLNTCPKRQEVAAVSATASK